MYYHSQPFLACSGRLKVMGERKNGTREGDTRGERERLPGRTMKIVSRPLSNYLAAAAWSVKNFDTKRLFEQIITIVKGFQIQAPGKCFISSIRSRFWWYTFHRQSKPRSSFWTNNISSDLHFNDSTNLLSAAASANAYLMSNCSFVALLTNRNFLHSQKASKNGQANLSPHVSPSSARVLSFLG